MHRFTFNPETLAPQTTTLILDKGEKLNFWNSLDVTYKPPITLGFYITIKAEKEPPTEIFCDALNPTLTFMSSTIEKDNYIDKSWKIARMNCELGPIEEKQAVTITATPKADGIGTLQVNGLILELKH
ncbi:hypothetical protein [Synechococcus sp. A15-127]|uniref:hypothetical protein n=1 Tax=Synechococcus sp. A15-127 TaxID=1050624 RepID=UPI0021052ED5|nr:hypothetical protein [Synechococcus sp. A15-127]